MTLDPQITTAIVGVVATAITVLGGWGLSILERKLGIDRTDRAQQAFEQAISNGIALASNAVASAPQPPGSSGNQPAALSSIVAQAVAFAGPKIAPEMKQLGIDPATLPERVAARVAVAAMPQRVAVSDALTTPQPPL